MNIADITDLAFKDKIKTFTNNHWYTLSFFTAIVVYYLISIAVGYLIFVVLYPKIPDIDTNSEVFRIIYNRNQWDSTYIPIGPLIYYCIINMIGYTFTHKGS